MKENLIIQGQIIRPFSPTIGKYKIPDNKVDILNNHIDEILKDEKKIEELYHGKKLAGEIKYEIKLTKEFLDKNMCEILRGYVFNFIKSTIKKEISKFDLRSSWAVCQFESDYNPIHWHDGHISGVMYTKMPDDLGSSYKDENRNGRIAFIHGATQFLVSSVYEVQPKVGDLFIFPSYMMHTVYPFFSDQERRSISFNAFIDDDVASY